MVRSEEVEEYYERMTSGYLETYGDTIQAFRMSNLSELHDYTIKSAGMIENMKILDAGCGVCGPAIHFAKKLNVEIHGINISASQLEIAKRRIDSEKLKGKIFLYQGDYHHLTDYLNSTNFDLVLFLETLGHAHNPDQVIKSAFDVMAPGGIIYLKDFYPFEVSDPIVKKRHQKVIENINTHYNYNTLNFYDTMRSLRGAGFEILEIKKMGYDTDTTAWKAFEARYNIDLFDGGEEFSMVEWLEISCRKPEVKLF